jgi:hypothetical protein
MQKISASNCTKKTAQHSVHPTGGSLRVFKQFRWLEAGSGKAALPRLAHPRVTHTVGRFNVFNLRYYNLHKQSNLHMKKQIQIVIENEFVTLDESTATPNSSVFTRAFRKLTEEKSSIGKIFPIFIKIENKHYTLGVFALNRLGSTTLFLELPEGTFFDHITFGKNLIPNKCHLTEIVENQRKKVTALEPAQLSNGTYHVLTLLVNNLTLLKLAPKEIVYPPVDIEFVDLVKEAILTDGKYNGSGILEAVGNKGVIVVQIFLIPKGVSFELLEPAIDSGFLKNIFDKNNFKNIQMHKAYLGHEFQSEYQFGLVSYRYDAQIDETLYLEYPTTKNGMYFNSADTELKRSVANAVRASRIKNV